MAKNLRRGKQGRRLAVRPIVRVDSVRPLRFARDAASPAGPVPFNGLRDAVNGTVAANNPRSLVPSDSSQIGSDNFAALAEAAADEAWPTVSLPMEPTAKVLQGRIEKITRTTIKGWVWDPQAPNGRIRLELVEGRNRLQTAVADNDRPDLIQLGCGDGRHGFDIAWDEALLSECQHALTLRCADTGAAMPGSPIVIDRRPSTAVEPHGSAASASKSPPALHAYIDEVSESGILGWIMLPDQPSRRCIVALKEGDRILARTSASRFRLDLLSAGVGDGCYSFAFEPPRSLFDGREHLLEVVDEDTGARINKETIHWYSGMEMRSAALTQTQYTDVTERKPLLTEAGSSDHGVFLVDPMWSNASRVMTRQSAGYVGTRILFDVSDLIYYVGHHSNLTGIQRVQSSIILSLIDGNIRPSTSVIFLSFNTMMRSWVAIPTKFLVCLLRDLLLPTSQRLVTYPAEAARCGVLPGAQAFDGTGILDDGNPSVLCLLGAAWVHQDYVRRILVLKRRFGTRFVMAVHDLIPIFARETCDQDTGRVFEQFMRRALLHVDHILAVSNYTANDVRRYLAALRLPVPPITVTQNGSSFAEFLPNIFPARAATQRSLPKRFILFVATIEGRKNHPLMFEIWRRMVEEGDDPPDLFCVGRLGWKVTAFISALVESNYLNGRIHLLCEVSDSDLHRLYDRCLFTVCPSFYEGWGLTVTEALAMGKICVSSDRASIPEVAGRCGVYIDIDSIEQSLGVIRNLIGDKKARKKLEAKIRREYVPITWRSVAQKVAAVCEAAVDLKWQQPYPYAILPYSTEIAFGRLDQDTDGSGESVLARIVDARRGHFNHEPLVRQSFLLGEEARSNGVWAEPERWGTWLCHTRGDLMFGLGANADQTYFVFMRLRVCGLLHQQPVRLIANGERHWQGFVGPKSIDIVLRIRKRAKATEQWMLQIEAEVGLSPEVRGKIAALDNRIPTIGFERLMVVPESDVKTRLDVLTNLVLPGS
jgi:glycosyltransferase involved in cell wall biosynthesis